MKKILAMLLAAVMLLALAACGTTADETSAPPSDDAAVSEAPVDESETPSEPADAQYVVGICQQMTHDALDAATQGFKDALADILGEGAVEYSEGNAGGEQPNCVTIIDGLVSENVDLILANATWPLQAAYSATSEIPVLGTSVTDYGTALGISDWIGKTGTNISGTTDLAPLDGQADMLKELFPDAKNVGLLYCSAEPNSKYQIDTIKPLLEAQGYTCTEFAFTDSNDVASVAQNAASGSDVIYIPTDNTAASCTEAIANVVIPAKVPVIAGEQGICSGCGVATLSIDYNELGQATGEMAYEILVKGANPGDMEVQAAPTFTKMYNKANCEKLGITIPDDYTAIEG